MYLLGNVVHVSLMLQKELCLWLVRKGNTIKTGRYWGVMHICDIVTRNELCI